MKVILNFLTIQVSLSYKQITKFGSDQTEWMCIVVLNTRTVFFSHDDMAYTCIYIYLY